MSDTANNPIVVVGAGPAGMAAAVSAAQAGARVLLVDDNPGLGGQIRSRHRALIASSTSSCRRPSSRMARSRSFRLTR